MFGMRHSKLKEVLPISVKGKVDLKTLDKDVLGVYHCTTFRKVNKLLESNYFKCHISYSDEKPHICCTHKANYVVFTDSKIQLVLNKEKLENDFKSKDIDIYGRDYEGEIRYYIESDTDKTIENFTQYISEVRISETSLSCLFLHDLLALNCSFNKALMLVDGSLDLEDLDFSELSEVLKLDRLCKQYNIPMCSRLTTLIECNKNIFSQNLIGGLSTTEITVYHEEHALQQVPKQYYEIKWGNYVVFSGYSNDEAFRYTLTKIYEKCLHLMNTDVLYLYKTII